MPELNCDIPPLEVWVDARFLFGMDEAKRGEWEKGVAFAACSIPGQVVTFHVLLESGAVFGRLPIHAMRDRRRGRTKPSVDDETDPNLVQVWDCPSYHIVCTEYAALGGLQCYSGLAPIAPCEYLFTLDWYGSAQAEGAGDLGWKSGNIVVPIADDSRILCLPNNRIFPWLEKAFTDSGALVRDTLPRYSVQQQTYSCEGV